MFQSVQQRRKTETAIAVDIAPLIDIVFILLIFFLLTTTFVQDQGVAVTKPQASQTQPLDPQSLRVSITASGSLFTGGRQVEMSELRQEMQAFVRRQPDGAVVVVPDEAVPAGRLVEVMDQARLAGARDVALATRSPEAR